MRWRWGVIGLVAVLVLLTYERAWAHATLLRSDPPANSVLTAAPAEIRLWFSEALEPNFSRFTLHDINNKPLDTLGSQVDPGDAKQMFMKPGKLPDGLYTVVWQTVSAQDGHALQGSFPFTIGPAVGGQAAITPIAETIPPDSAVVRWLNLVSLALLVGGVSFVLFVWKPAAFAPQPDLDRRLDRLIGIGWILVGITGVLMLLLQVSTAAQVPLFDAISNPALWQIITVTRYGSLWLARTGLWLMLGGVLFWPNSTHSQRFYWLALALGGAILLTNSLYSHASAAQDSFASVVSDWLHLSLAALWVGGLVQLFILIVPVWRRTSLGIPALGTLVSHFSNFVRVAVVGLIVTGFYAAWLQVESLDGLLTTLYGQVLLIKLLLIVPLLAVAGINFLFTQRALEAGKPVWAGRLRGLVGLEIALTVGVLAAVGALTSLNTSRNDLALRAALAAAPEPIVDTQSADNLHVKLTISPGVVGQNTFVLALSDIQGKPVSDVSLIRLRFDDQTENIGESELRITQGQDGIYTLSGANLSVPGTWRIRAMIQRPDQYDAIADFKPHLDAASPPIDVNAPLPNRVPILLIVGLLALGSGGFFISQSRLLSGAGLLSGGLLLIGVLFLANGLGSLVSDTPTTSRADTVMATLVANCYRNPGGSTQNVGPSPSIHIASPADGSTISQNPLILQITTNNVTVDPKHYMQTFVDGKLASRDSANTVVLNHLSAGDHTICVVTGDTSQPSTLVTDGIRIMMKPASVKP